MPSDCTKVMRRIRLWVLCAKAIQQIDQMSAIRSAVASGRVFGRFDRQIGSTAGCIDRRERTGVQFICVQQRTHGLLGFTDVNSCGTETAVSVPCMFSGMPRKDYDASVARNREGLLDMLQRAGLAVQWRDNQSGCKGTCDRVQFIDVSNLKDPGLCAGGECHDEILLREAENLGTANGSRASVRALIAERLKQKRAV